MCWKYSHQIRITKAYSRLWASLVAQRLKGQPAMQDTWVQSLGHEDPLEKEMATHSSFLPGESHGQRSLVATVHRVAKSQTRLNNFTFTFTVSYSHCCD